jgi:RNA polymerase sigma-70 factor (ECF subfamily)
MIPETVRRAQAGDENAFEELYTKYKQRTYFLCLKMTQDHAQAEDLTQDTFLCAHQKLGLFRGDSAFSTWLYRIAMNMTLMSFRKTNGRVMVPIPGDGEEPIPDAPSAFVFRDRELEQVPMRLALERAIGSLSSREQELLTLFHVDGLTLIDLATVLSRPLGTIKAQLTRTRRKVRLAMRRIRTQKN